MARSGAAGRVCYLALLLTAAVIFYQHHVAMQKELTHYQHAALQFEKMYEDSMKTVSEWQNKYESEKIKSAEVQEAHDLTKKQLSDETQSQKTLQSNKASLESKLEQEKQARSRLDSDLQSKDEDLKKAFDQLSQTRAQTKEFESRISSYSAEAEQLKIKINSLEIGKQQLEDQLKQMSLRASQTRAHENRRKSSLLEDDDDNVGEDLDGVTNEKRVGEGQGASNLERREPNKLEYSHTGIGFGGDTKKMEGNLKSTVDEAKRAYRHGGQNGWNREDVLGNTEGHG